jgi:hypothetical protein
MNTTENLISTGCPATAPQPINQVIKPVKFPAQPQEWKIVSLRECPTPDTMQHCETPEQAAAYWKTHIATHPYFNSECECLVVFILNTRRRIKGHYLVSIGTMDTILCHPREVFRLAIMASAAAIIIAHNHPSGESTPSEADIKITRDLIRAGQLLKIEVLDHIVIGNPNHSSLRSLGLFLQLTDLGLTINRAFSLSSAGTTNQGACLSAGRGQAIFISTSCICFQYFRS